MVLLQLGQDDEACASRALHRSLGLSKKGTSIEATVAMRRGDWADARRLIVRIESIPDEIKPDAHAFVDALAQP